MAQRRRLIKDGFVKVLNPMPEFTVKECADAAGLLLRSAENPNLHVFKFEYQLRSENPDTPAASELIELEPGDHMDIPREIANQMFREEGERGWCVIVDKGGDEKLARLRGLERGLNWWAQCGSIPLAKKQAGYNQEEKDAFKQHLLYSYHMSKAKEEAIKTEIKRLQGK